MATKLLPEIEKIMTWDSTFRPMFEFKQTDQKQITPIKMRKGRPAYTLKANQTLREEMSIGLWCNVNNEPMTLELLKSVTISFLQFMNWDFEHYHNVFESIKPYANKFKLFDYAARSEVIYALAGASMNLHAGEMLPLPGATIVDTWLALEITKAELSRKHRDKQLVTLDFHVVAGPTTGTTYSQEFPLNRLGSIFKESIKFDKYVPLEYWDLFGVNLMGYMSYADDGTIQFTEIATNSYQDKINRGIKKARRLDCHNETPYLCHECPAGADRCPNATHLETHTLDYCANTYLDKHQGFIDTTRKDGYCTSCAVNLATGVFYEQERFNGREKEGNQA